MEKRGWHRSVEEKKRENKKKRKKEKRGKQKEVASMACTHEGGAKLLQLLPAAASSLHGGLRWRGSPTQSRRGESFTVKP